MTTSTTLPSPRLPVRVIRTSEARTSTSTCNSIGIHKMAKIEKCLEFLAKFLSTVAGNICSCFRQTCVISLLCALLIDNTICLGYSYSDCLKHGDRFRSAIWFKLFALYTDPESHNAQRYRQTDERHDDAKLPIADRSRTAVFSSTIG